MLHFFIVAWYVASALTADTALTQGGRLHGRTDRQTDDRQTDVASNILLQMAAWAESRLQPAVYTLRRHGGLKSIIHNDDLFLIVT